MRRVGYKHPHCRYADWDSDAHPLDRQSLLWAARQPPSASRLLAIQSPLLLLPLADPSPLHGFDSVPRRRLVLTEDEREKLDLEMVPHWVTDTLDDTPLDADPPVVYQPLNIFPEVVTHQFFSVVAKPL